MNATRLQQLTVRELRALGQSRGLGAWRLYVSKLDLIRGLLAVTKGQTTHLILQDGDRAGEAVKLRRSRAYPESRTGPLGTTLVASDDNRATYIDEANGLLYITGRVDTREAAERGWTFDPEAGAFIEALTATENLAAHRRGRRIARGLYRDAREARAIAKAESFLEWFHRRIGKLRIAKQPHPGTGRPYTPEEYDFIPWYMRSTDGTGTAPDVAAGAAAEDHWIAEGDESLFLERLGEELERLPERLRVADFHDQGAVLAMIQTAEPEEERDEELPF